MTIKRLSISLALLLSTPLLVLAAPFEFERDLYFGLRNDSDVGRLQEFLRAQNIYSGPITGGFFSLTRGALKKFQEREGIMPAAGFFGPKTRERANKISGKAVPTAASIQAQIAALEEQIKVLQEKLAGESILAPATSTPVSSASATATPPVAIQPSNTIRVSGASISTFPAIADLKPYKIGDFLIENGTASDVLFASFEAKISDEMDSYLNRNRRVFFIMRNGPSALDELVSSTAFRFITTPPKIGSPHKSFLVLPYAKVIKSGGAQNASLWIEQLDYVRSGTLAVDTFKISATAPKPVEGSFNFVLTKEPPL